MARPPKDPNPVASTGGVANSQGQAIFTGDWNALITDYVSQTDTSPQQVTGTITLNNGTIGLAGNTVADVLAAKDLGGTGFSVHLLPAEPAVAFTGDHTTLSIAMLMGWQDAVTNLPTNYLSDNLSGGYLDWGDDGTTIFGTGLSTATNPNRFLRPIFDSINSLAAIPTSANIPAGFRATFLDTRTGGLIRQLYNNAGTLTPVLSTGQVVLVNSAVTQNSATVPNADTNLKTYSLAQNSYAQIIVEADGYVQESATSTLQDVNIKIKRGVTQMGQTMKFNPQAATAGAKTPFHIKISGAATAAQTIALTIGAAAADANTTVFANNLIVYGVV